MHVKYVNLGCNYITMNIWLLFAIRASSDGAPVWQCALRLVCSVCVLNWVCKSMIIRFSSPWVSREDKKTLYNLLKKKEHRLLASCWTLCWAFQMFWKGGGSRTWDWRHWRICALRDLQSCASARSDRWAFLISGKSWHGVGRKPLRSRRALARSRRLLGGKQCVPSFFFSPESDFNCKLMTRSHLGSAAAQRRAMPAHCRKALGPGGSVSQLGRVFLCTLPLEVVCVFPLGAPVPTAV